MQYFRYILDMVFCLIQHLIINKHCLKAKTHTSWILFLKLPRRMTHVNRKEKIMTNTKIAMMTIRKNDKNSFFFFVCLLSNQNYTNVEPYSHANCNWLLANKNNTRDQPEQWERPSIKLHSFSLYFSNHYQQNSEVKFAFSLLFLLDRDINFLIFFEGANVDISKFTKYLKLMEYETW